MRYLRLIGSFAKASAQNELAYRLNFWISLLYAILNLGTGILALVVLFNQVQNLHGWTLPSTLALLGIYLTIVALRSLFIGPSLDSLAGMDGEIWTGRFDFTMLRPVNTQFLASLRYWRPLALLDLVLGLVVLVYACLRLGQSLSLGSLLAFLLAITAAVVILYAILLTFSALVLYNPTFLFTWVIDSLFQMARYPVGVYPGWLRLILTWIIPVGMITTVPAQALSGAVTPGMLAGSLALAVILFCAASLLFNFGLRKYTSASS